MLVRLLRRIFIRFFKKEDGIHRRSKPLLSRSRTENSRAGAKTSPQEGTKGNHNSPQGQTPKDGSFSSRTSRVSNSTVIIYLKIYSHQPRAKESSTKILNTSSMSLLSK
ncbi:hypothetical protein AVEN_27622-1 [Araneus ventricosus]|uniref:Uncharacterized protein n=1 Tax=Araneus ventricosus TaxID=182803 RepID=A0A4Y2EP09_ARAVE|nr:hypothetical protein AVEN_27622-1 [Araneus ventricosus]